MADDSDDDSGPPRGALIMLVVLVGLVAGTVFIMHRINEASTMQDCLAAGRTNCAPVATTAK